MIIDNYFNLGLLLGAILSFLLGVFLVFHPGRFRPNYVLGALVLCWSIIVLSFVSHNPEFFKEYPHLYGSMDVFTLFFYPLIYLYIRSYLYADFKIRGIQLLHFLPSLAYLICISPFIVLSGNEKIYMILNGLPIWYSIVQMVFNVIIIIQGFSYSVLSLRLLHHFQYFRKKRLSEKQIGALNWLRLFVVLYAVLLIVGSAGAYIEIVGITIFIDLFKVYYAGLTLLTFWLGTFAVFKPELFTENENLSTFIRKSFTNSVGNQQSENQKEYEKLKNYLTEEKPYLNTELKLQDLCDPTGLSYRKLSELFNNEFNSSFNDIINEFRIQEAIRLFKEGFHTKYTIPHLAETAGFNSKTTFNRVFKKEVGMTPTEYIKILNQED